MVVAPAIYLYIFGGVIIAYGLIAMIKSLRARKQINAILKRLDALERGQ